MPELLLRVSNLSKSLSGREVLHEISLEVQRGEFVGLIGPNGAGKTTLLRCITGQWKSPAGRVTIEGTDVAAEPVAAKRRFGYAFEPADLIERLTGRQHVHFLARLRGLAKPEAEIRQLAGLVDIGEMLDAETGTYSFGTKQKLGLVLALLGRPPLIILDESLNGLDPIVAFRMKNYLKNLAAQGGTGVLLASHMLESLEKYCTRIAMIREGRIFRTWTREELGREADGSGKSLEDLFVELMGETA